MLGDLLNPYAPTYHNCLVDTQLPHDSHHKKPQAMPSTLNPCQEESEGPRAHSPQAEQGSHTPSLSPWSGSLRRAQDMNQAHLSSSPGLAPVSSVFLGR